MDCLLLLCDPAHTTGYDGKGDFVIGSDGRLTRAKAAPQGKALAYIGGYLVHPRLFATAPTGAFSMNLLWDRAIARAASLVLPMPGIGFMLAHPKRSARPRTG